MFEDVILSAAFLVLSPEPKYTRAVDHAVRAAMIQTGAKVVIGRTEKSIESSTYTAIESVGIGKDTAGAVAGVASVAITSQAVVQLPWKPYGGSLSVTAARDSYKANMSWEF